MKYTEFKLYASSQGIEMASQVFMSNGILQLSIDDPADVEDILNKKNDYEWDYIDESLVEDRDREPTVAAYFGLDEESEALMKKLSVELKQLKQDQLDGIYGSEADFGRMHIQQTVVDDSDWKDKWKAFFKPTKVTDTIVVKPSWEDYHAKAGEAVLEIDPGIAFGTGTHETTSLCMKLMEKYMPKDRAEAQACRILDIGCGSGILSIAGALLGSGNVLGVEIDPEAVDVAKENVELNNVADCVKVQQGDLTEGIDFQGDILVANLMHNLVIMLSESARKHISPGGIYISSGIILEKKELVAKAVREAGFEILEIPEDGDWCAIAARAGK